MAACASLARRALGTETPVMVKIPGMVATLMVMPGIASASVG